MAGGASRSAEAAERYAGALFDLALDAKAIDATVSDLNLVRDMLASSEDFRRMVESPAFSAEDKQGALIAVAKKAGVSDLTTRFFGVLAGNRRAHELASVLDVFDALVAEHNGVVTAEVETAKPLSAVQEQSLADTLKKLVGKEVQIRADVKPEILGGLIVKVGSRMFDSSLKTKLEGLKTAMKGT